MLRDITWKHKLLRQQLWDLVGMPYMSITRLIKCTKLRSMRGIIRSMTIIIVIKFLGTTLGFGPVDNLEELLVSAKTESDTVSILHNIL
jgi:hypothetical protein